MDPIASYTERLPQVTRTFTLHSDHVLVQAHWRVKGDFTNKVPLAALKPQYKELKIRNKLFKPAAVVLAAGVVLVAFGLYPQWPRALSGSLLAGMLMVVVGGVLSGWWYRAVRFVRFDSDKGKPGLDMARAGPDRDSFDEFIERVQKQIRAEQRRGAGA
jgi:hypothetical protein